MLKEMVVVEGRNDVQAVCRSIEADVIMTSGFGITEATLMLIRKAVGTRGVIVLTDPDYMGKCIRQVLDKKIEGLLHAHISREEGRKHADIGVENASPASILKALARAKAMSVEDLLLESGAGAGAEVAPAKEDVVFEAYQMADLIWAGLAGSPDSERLRRRLTEQLNLGPCNGKLLLKRLNQYKIPHALFESTLNALEEDIREV